LFQLAKKNKRRLTQCCGGFIMITAILYFNHWQSIILDHHQAVWPVSAFLAVPAMFALTVKVLPDNAEMLIVLKVNMLLCNFKKTEQKMIYETIDDYC
jgi:hypothetical protein